MTTQQAAQAQVAKLQAAGIKPSATLLANAGMSATSTSTPQQTSAPLKTSAPQGSSMPASGNGSLAPSDQLVDTILLKYKTNQNVQQFQEWKDAAPGVRQEAYAQIQSIFSNPQNVANYVTRKGVTGLQGYQWWSSQADSAKQQAWSLVQQSTGQSGASATLTPAQEAAKYLDAIDPTLKNDPNVAALLKNDPDSALLSAFAGYTASTVKSGEDEVLRRMNDAMSEAMKQADPYWREQIGTIKDSLSRTLGTYDADLASAEAELSRRRMALDEDLKFNKANLTMDEQIELSRQRDILDEQIRGTREEMGARGLGSSSIKSRAEEIQRKNNQYVVGSIQRQAERANRNLDVTAQRGFTDLTAQAADMKRRTEAAKTDAVRKTEGYLGSSDTGGVNGAGQYLQGGISGGILTDRANDTLTRAYGLLDPTNTLNNLLNAQF